MTRRPRNTDDAAFDDTLPLEAEPPALAELPAAPAAPAVIVAPAAPIVHEPVITVERFARSVRKYPQGIVAAFASGEQRENGTRKLTQAAWESHFTAFLHKPR